jgi:hypothetical protein
MISEWMLIRTCETDVSMRIAGDKFEIEYKLEGKNEANRAFSVPT